MRKFFTKKKIIWSVIIILVFGFIAFKIAGGGNKAENIVTEKVKRQNIKQTVLATGQVVSQTDLALSFKASGAVTKVNIKEGDRVKAGDILATLQQKDQIASLTQARGSLAQAEANYQRILAGASSEEILVAQKAVDGARVTLDNAKKNLTDTKSQQDVLVKNAQQALLNSTLSAVADSGNTGTAALTVSGIYNGTQEGGYRISIYSTGSGLRFQYNGLETGDGIVTTSPQPLGKRGLFIQFSSTSVPANNTWSINIPNTQAVNYITNLNAYQAAMEARKVAITSMENAVSAAQASLAQAEASLELRKAQARPADISAAKAQILSAQGQLLAAEAVLENTVIRAPANGTITKVEIKVGEQATALKEAMVLQDTENMHVEANVSEANIASLKTGQSVELTFDALSLEREFQGTVQAVNPASNVISGVVNYKVTVSVEKVEEIKPGMTANLTIKVAEKDGVLVVPQRAILSQEGKKAVRVIKDAKKKDYEEIDVTTGLEADGGVVEIVSGLSEGQEIVTLIKK